MRRRKGLLLAVAVCVAATALAGLAVGDETLDVAETETVGRQTLFATVTGTGMVQPRRKVDISADVSGRVVALPVEEGSWVERGDLLLRIDPEQFEAAVLRAEASVAQAGAAAEQVRANWLQAASVLRRSEELAGSRGWVTRAELEQQRSQVAVLAAQLRSAEFGVAQAQAGLREARKVLAKTTITAPMSGRVTRLNIREGETAVVGTMNNPGSLLLTVADLSEMEARIRVDETDVPRITLGDSVVVRVDAFAPRTFTGRVVRVANSASRANGQPSAHFQVTVALDRLDVPLHPELSASADIVTETRAGVVAVPLTALTARTRRGTATDAAAGGREAGVEGVFVLRDGTARWTPVQVGVVGRRFAEVRAGLRGGETVVAGPYERVRALEDGEEVEARPAGAPAAPRP